MGGYDNAVFVRREGLKSDTVGVIPAKAGISLRLFSRLNKGIPDIFACGLLRKLTQKFRDDELSGLTPDLPVGSGFAIVVSSCIIHM